MALAEKGDGILETHLKWEELEEQMQKAFGTAATFGPNKSARNIGEGNGFLSRVSLIYPDWQPATEGLPDTFVAKISSALSLVDLCGNQAIKVDVSTMLPELVSFCSKFHNMEIETYKILDKYNESRISVPKIYATRKFTEDNSTVGYILMNFFENISPCHLTDNISVKSIKKAIRNIATLQGIGLKMTEEEKSIFPTTFIGDTFGDMYSPEIIKQFKTGLENFCGPENSKIVDEFVNFLNLAYSTEKNYYKLDCIPDRLGYQRVFCHGDMWVTNILWTKLDDNFQLCAHIDFQTASFNSCALDLARLFTACLSGADRRNHQKELLSIFYDYLREEVEGELPYTLEQLYESYEYCLPLGALLVTSAMIQLLPQFVRENPDSVDQVKETLREKTLALLEDAIECYRNYPLE